MSTVLKDIFSIYIKLVHRINWKGVVIQTSDIKRH